MSETGTKLTEPQLASLRWMAKVNKGGRDKGGIGLWGPTVRRVGHVPEGKQLIHLGLARLSDDGYWILPAGRAALAQAEETKE